MFQISALAQNAGRYASTGWFLSCGYRKCGFAAFPGQAQVVGGDQAEILARYDLVQATLMAVKDRRLRPPLAGAWVEEHTPAIRAIVERCVPSGPPPDWSFSVFLPGQPATRSSGPTSGTVYPDEVHRCIDEGMRELPANPDPAAREAGTGLVVRW